ncbi:MAG: hypothetical protein HYR93_06370 [Chloroflexi bacterium]|nr:hypothetical protein [Chloroflexota bacterium]
MNKRIFNFLVIATILVLTLSLAGPAWAGSGGTGGGNSDSTNNGPRVDTSSALVQLKGDSLATYVKTKPPQGKKIDLNSNTVKSYRAQLSAERNDFKKWLQARRWFSALSMRACITPPMMTLICP